MLDRIVIIKQSRLFIAETILGIMVLLAINVIFFPMRPFFDGIYPNPYWAIILAISARYGRNGAIFASIACSVVCIAHYVISFQGIDVLYDDPWLLRFPFLFFLVGFLVGELKNSFLLREDFLSRRVEELETVNEMVKKELDILKTAHKDLTTDVATTQQTMTVLSKISDRLKSFSPEVIYEGILGCFQEYSEVEECSIYLKEGPELVLKYTKGWKDYYKRPETVKFGEGLIGRAAEKKKTYSIKDIVMRKIDTDEGQLDVLGDTALAIPMLDLENNLYGVVGVEKIPFLKLTQSTIQKLKTICRLAESSLNNAYTFSEIEREQIKEKEFDLFKYHYFLTRVNEEYLRSLNYMLPTSIAAFHWHKLSALPIEKRGPVLESIIKIIKVNLRTFDVLSRGPDEKIPLTLLLATTPKRQAEALKEKFIAKINDYNLGSVISEKELSESILIADYNPREMKDVNEFLASVGINK